MHNVELARDYVRRAGVRLRAIEVLYDAGSWADVVRESQEVVELALKGLLRSVGVDPPRIHDVSSVLIQEKARLPASIAEELDALVRISKNLRRDRELAFDGGEDLIPSEFYACEDADVAFDGAKRVVGRVSEAVEG